MLGHAIAALGATAGAVVRLDGDGALRLAGAAGAQVPPSTPGATACAGAAADDPLAAVARERRRRLVCRPAPPLAVVPLLRSGNPAGALGLTFPAHAAG